MGVRGGVVAASWRAPGPGSAANRPLAPAHQLAGMLGPGCPGVSCQEEAASRRVVWAEERTEEGQEGEDARLEEARATLRSQ